MDICNMVINLIEDIQLTERIDNLVPLNMLNNALNDYRQAIYLFNEGQITREEHDLAHQKLEKIIIKLEKIGL